MLHADSGSALHLDAAKVDSYLMYVLLAPCLLSIYLPSN